uniref:Growth factor receptor bound protein 7 n=1 Tax=Meleagris gallopavo TaxID=9103 RepID=A0A803XKN9_MELGA
MLVQRTHALHDHSWALVELHQYLALERCLEDHESVVEVQSMWPLGADSRFVFRKNFAKYELFKSNTSLFPEVMVSSCLEANKSMAHSELIQNFLNSGSCPEVQGFLQLREASRKVWKRFYFSLRRSGLYYSTKGTSKDPRHLQYFADLTESNIYYVTQGKKHYGTPTEFGFCIKPYKVRSGVKGLKLLCSEDEQSRTCWIAAFRLFKYGMQLYRNYQQAQARLSQHPWITPTPLQSVSDSALVAMDFSGCTGRVIENPSEVLTAVLEEAQAWRVSGGHRLGVGPPLSVHSLCCLLCTARRRRHTGTACLLPARAPRSVLVSNACRAGAWRPPAQGFLPRVGGGPLLMTLSSPCSHPPHPAMVPRAHLAGGHPAAHRPSGAGGWVRNRGVVEGFRDSWGAHGRWESWGPTVHKGLIGGTGRSWSPGDGGDRIARWRGTLGSHMAPRGFGVTLLWGSQRVPGAGEPAQPQGLRAVPVPPAESQALSHPASECRGCGEGMGGGGGGRGQPGLMLTCLAERGGGAALLHHGRRTDPLC